jgi:hypothetical protein
MRRSTWSNRRFAPLLTVAAACLLACDQTEPRGPGALRINATASSQEAAFFQYAVAIDSGTPWTAFVGQPLTIFQTGMSHGPHLITVSGTPASCTGREPRTATIAGDDTVVVTVTIVCPRTTGDVKVNVTTSGPDQDSNGYFVRVNGLTRGFVNSNGSTIITSLAAGSHEVTLSDVASNCTLAAPQSALVTAGTLTNVNLSVTCTAVSVLRFVATASGPDRDPDGYSILVDSVQVGTLLQSQSVNVRVAPGLRNWAATDIQPNCAMAEGNSGSVTLAANDTVTIPLSATCSTIPMGAVGTAVTDPANDTITTSLTGPNPPHDILGVTARYATDWFILVVRFSTPMISNVTADPKALNGFIEFDVDENAATGSTPFSNLFGATANIGVDYSLSFANDSVSTILVRRGVSGPVPIHRVRTRFEGDSVIVQIPITKFGADEGNMAVVMTVGPQDRPTDIAPNTGATLLRVPGASAPMLMAPASAENIVVRKPLLVPPPGQPWWGIGVAAPPRP